MLRWYLKSCTKCGGDLYPDIDPIHHLTELACLQCGHILYSDIPNPTLDRVDVNLNLVIKSHNKSRDRWFIINEDIIKYLNLGYSTNKVAFTLNKDLRRVREVKAILEEEKK